MQQKPILGQGRPVPEAPRTEASVPQATDEAATKAQPPEEIGGRGGLDPVRYGDWEKNGRCIDF